MKLSPWFIPWRVACLIAGNALCCSAPAQPQPPRPTMAEAMDAAWPRSLESAQAIGHHRQAQAQQHVASAWLAGAPTVSLSQREGQGPAAGGKRETEMSLGFPLWHVGQRDQQAQAAQADSIWADATERAARLRVAAQLREQASMLQFAEMDAQLAFHQRKHLQDLSIDVDKRVQAGELAPSDGMAAKADMLAAKAQEDEAQQVLATRRSEWHLLTGLQMPPVPEIYKSEPAAALDQHAEAVLAEAAVQRARARIAQIQTQREVTPELGLSVRYEAPGQGLPHQNAILISFSTPFGTEIQNQPKLAEALAGLDLALATQQRVQQQLTSELTLARRRMATSTAQASTEAERATLLRERAKLLLKSFRSGQSSLPDLLRAMSAAAQAESASARQQATLYQAQSRLQQAFGQLP